MTAYINMKKEKNGCFEKKEANVALREAKVMFGKRVPMIKNGVV